MTESALVYLALGSNLGDPIKQLAKARAAINTIPGVAIVRASSLYQSPPWGSAEAQPDYVNAVIAVETRLFSYDLWRATSQIEAAQGRLQNSARNAARTIDIDLLLCGDERTQTAELTLPHPRMHERDFVLMPLVEIAPDVVIPGRGNARDCLQRILPTGIRKLGHNSAWI